MYPHGARLGAVTIDLGDFPVAFGEPDWLGRVERGEQGDVHVPIMRDEVEVPVRTFDRDDVLALARSART